jgi:hypothetical protein
MDNQHHSNFMGPFSPEQTPYIVVALFISFTLYLFIGESHFFLFLLTSIIVFAIAIVLAFYKKKE